jgi:hypothetical protein
MNTNDYCPECRIPVAIVDDSIESDDYGNDYRVITFSCWHQHASRI